MAQQALKSTLERIAAGLGSGDIKEAVAILLLQNVILDHTADPRRVALMRETLKPHLQPPPALPGSIPAPEGPQPSPDA